MNQTAAPSRASRLRIIVGGMVGNFPLGGVAWDYFHYALALAELGHDVYYYEDTWVWPHNPVLGYPDNDPSYTVNFFRDFFAQYAPHLQDRWRYVLLHDKGFGMSDEAFAEVVRTADVFLNVSGACFWPEGLNPKCIKVFLDTDPGYNQIILKNKPGWSENVDRWAEQVRAHDRHLTYAENMHAADCLVPRVDLDWRPTRCVVTLPQWSTVRDQPPPLGAALTTVMTWRFFAGPVELDGLLYHGKVPEHDKFHDIPTRVTTPMVLAVSGSKYDPEEIRRDGWEFVDALGVTLTPSQYQRFIADSFGEWSVAKHIYVALNTGWFSCRTACYLAAGRPAIVQDTAWSRYVPNGTGLFAFSSMQQAIDSINTVAGDWKKHSHAAYEIAREHLAPDRVIPLMLDQILRA